MGEPRQVAEGWRRMREELAGRVERDPLPDGDLEDDADLPGMVVASLEARRFARWRMMCPQRFHQANWEWIEEEHGAQVVADLRAWVATSPRPNLVLVGPVGTGKSGAALLVCRADYEDRGLDVRFAPVVELLDELRPGGPDGALEELTDVPRLIVDDLGSEKATDWTAERLYAVVNRRWLEERPTIATTNFDTVDELRRILAHERTFSRLCGSDALVLELRGRDRRFR
jgi:DNA replication protein DnaC